MHANIEVDTTRFSQILFIYFINTLVIPLVACTNFIVVSVMIHPIQLYVHYSVIHKVQLVLPKTTETT